MTTTTRWRHFPSAIVLPGGQQMSRVYIVLAEGGEHAGLHVWRRPGEPAYTAPIDWIRTPQPPAGRAARNGFLVALADGGVAVVTASSGCRCGQLGRWAGPDWAGTVAVRS